MALQRKTWWTSVLRDNKISDREFEEVLDEAKAFSNLKTKVRARLTRQPTIRPNKQPDKDKMRKEIRSEVQEEMRKKIAG